MDIGYRKYVNEYINILDNIPNIIDIALYNSMEQNIDQLIDNILTYIHENFPSILISKNDIIEKVKSIYIQKTEGFKKNIEFRTASIKYDLNGSFSLSKIKEYIEKGNKDLKMCFNSISFGTNVSYKDTVINISSDIFGSIQRSSNNNLIFAKKTNETQNYINEETLIHYKELMNSYGQELLQKGLAQLENIFEIIKNYVETSNVDIINNYQEKTQKIA